MLIDPVEAALNDLHQRLLEQADHFDDAAGLLEGDPVSGLFRILAGERRQMAQELELHIRQGALPKSTNPDQELVGKVIRRVKTALSADARSVVLEERERAETELNERVQAAVRENVEPKLRELLEAIAERLSRCRNQLSELRGQDSGASAANPRAD